jgi:catechol 2,3-dioxygenase-like lactoylglutathione lyase family enzyme
VQLIDHVSITVRELAGVKEFYLAVMQALGARIAYERADAIGFGERNRPHDDVHTYLSIFESPAATSDPRRHCCLRAGSIAAVDAFHAAGVAAGGTSDGAPGLRKYHSGYYAAFLLDPEGNKIEAVFHHAEPAIARVEV